MKTDSSKVIDSNGLWRRLHFDEKEIHCLNSKKAIAAYSGGFDSTVALWWALDHYEDISLIILDYNQIHKEEVHCARKIASLTGVKTDLIKLDLPSDFWGINNNLTRGQAGLMTAIAALNIGTDGADIVHGILRSDTYPDCDRDYLDILAGILPNVRDSGAIGIATPLRAVKDKQAVCVLGFLYGAPINWTWSCRNPQNGKPCGYCAPCRARSEIWDQLTERYGISKTEIDEWQSVLGSPAHPTLKKISRDLLILVNAFIEMGGITDGVPAWRYHSPDGKMRIATWIRNPDAVSFSGRALGEVCKCTEIHGSFTDGSRWQLAICQDHTVAVTDRLPSIDIIEAELKKKLVGIVFKDR